MPEAHHTRTPISIPGKVVVFDYGEVISVTPTEADRQALLAAAGANADTFWPAYWRHRDDLDQGTVSIADYWRRVADETDAEWSDADIHRIWVADYRSWLSADHDTLEVLSDLRAGATRMALLSNAGADFGSYFRNSPLGDLFERVFVSGELGLIKPAPEIFHTVMHDLDITPAETIFVDNKAANIAGAAELGITAHVYTGAGELERFLRSLAAE